LIYQVRHITTYDYEDPVSVSHHVLRLTPRNLSRQRCIRSQIAITPAPPSFITRIDYFGNGLTFFTLREPHSRLTVEASSELEVETVEAPDFLQTPSWETVPRSLEAETSVEVLDAYQFVFDSQRVAASPELAAYAHDSFPAGRPLMEAVRDLTRRIHRISASTPERRRSRLRLRHSSKSAAAYVRISPICRSRACDRWASLRVM